ncbi:MAG: hypothetical protein DWQ34_15680 [Planctomycetota bacterium]|nr:MAG: hypothetical protein DWQ29_07810 [Planctomycetota bacterium]REJ91178.1 MAG: hypothetical protein DWQ34_15680 [Planctomycetota bacterium]REK20344.1 MAG: hypothetical protein DWQ41_25480 [Planctomycetota bacterium]REK26841.1 MAG: hypothetical protein DWQ45_26780 [Planctomycetota bacterium]
MLVPTKSHEIQRSMQAELRGDSAAAARHLMAAAHLELVLADDYAEAGDAAMSARALISAGSCFWRGGDPRRGREILEITAEVRQIAKTYIERLLMPQDAGGDALHLALASYYGVDVLLTWNCRHLANPNKFGHIESLNTELGLSVPLLTTPLNYLSEGDADA